METLRQALTVFKIIFKDTRHKGIKSMGGNPETNVSSTRFRLHRAGQVKTDSSAGKKLGKIALGVLIAFGLVAMLAYICGYSFIMASAAVAADMFSELLYTYTAFIQVIVMFFGSAVLINYMYFSKDNMLLASLPLRSKSIYIAKYAMTYVSELIICAIFTLPFFITAGIAAHNAGFAITAWYYIFTVIGTFLLPILPLLVASIVSIPLMYLVSFMKKRALGNAILVGIVSLGVISIYLVFMLGFNTMASETPEGATMPVLNPAMVSLFSGIKRFTIFNYPFVNSLIKNNAALNAFIYTAGLLVIFALSVLLSGAFYSKGMRMTMESSSQSNSKNNGKITYASNDFVKSYVKKEIKTIANTPSLLVGVIMSIVMMPVFTLIFGKSLSIGGEDALSGFGNELMTIGLIMYMAIIMMASGNTVASVGISMEGKNLYILKSLPVSVSDVLKPKIIVSMGLNCIMAVVTTTALFFASSYRNPLISLLIFITLMLSGLGTSSNGLLHDLKNPNLNYKNVTELTKNNKKLIKPMLMNLALGFAAVILGMVLGIMGDDIFPPAAKYAVYFSVMILINGTFALLSWKKLYDRAGDYYDNMEV